MNATGRPSRDTILDDIIYYIDNNFRNNIKLEGSAPSSATAVPIWEKIFNKTFGESFNCYVDTERSNTPRSY